VCFKTVTETVIEKVKDVFGHAPVSESGIERPSPKGRVSQVFTTKKNGEWWVEYGPFTTKPRLTGVADTNSMDTFIDRGYTASIDRGEIPADIVVGDVIIYDVGYGEVIHQVVEIDSDEKGRFFRCKGINNKGVDPWIIRDGNIRGVWTGTIPTKKGVNTL